MKLVTVAQDVQPEPAALIGNEILNLRRAVAVVDGMEEFPQSVASILDLDGPSFSAAHGLIQRVAAGEHGLNSTLRATGALTLADTASLLAPLPEPRLIVSHGKAYHSHVRDFEKEAVAEPPNHPPAGFVKSNSAITGPHSNIRLPRVAPSKVDFEGELCVVFGRRAHGVSRHDAWNYIAGFTIINDVSARDWVEPSRKAVGYEAGTFSALNTMYKCFPTFCPMGPLVATLDEFSAIPNLHLVTRLNDEIMQDAWTSELIWPIPELIEHYSSIFSFSPGDLLSTGTPGGVGAGRSPPVYLKPGDVVSITVDGLGTLTNRIVLAD